MKTVRREEEGEEENLEGAKGHVRRNQQGRSGTGGEDTQPEVFDERSHNYDSSAVVDAGVG